MVFQKLLPSLAALAIALATSLPAQTLTVTDLREGATATAEVTGFSPRDSIMVANSMAGGGPTSTAYGMMDLSWPIATMPPVLVALDGTASVEAMIPAGSEGVSVWIQAINLTTNEMTNSLAEVISSATSAAVYIPGGTFEMGDHFDVGDANELPVHTVVVDGFWMDVFEMTNIEYSVFLNDSNAAGLITVVGKEVFHSGRPICDTTYWTGSMSRITWSGANFGVVAGKDNHAMVDVSWYGGLAYANWRSEQQGLVPCYDLNSGAIDFNANGWRLPTEAEWEYAARGGTAKYSLYHWGSQINGSHANYNTSGDPWEGGFNSIPETSHVGYYNGNQIPSGNDMANGYGLYDMAGNVFEWCQDRHDGNYYSYSPTLNPRGPSVGATRSIRGGAWNNYISSLRSAERSHMYPFVRIKGVGFRLVSVH